MNQEYPLALPVGSVLAGQYIIERVLGQGGFGITYQALDHKTGKKVAVKEFFPDTLVTRTNTTTVTPYTGDRMVDFGYGKACFTQEAETLAKFIGNPNIVRIHTYFEENQTAYFAMEYVDGISFDRYIRKNGGKVTYEDAKRILFPIMEALYRVHKAGIVHRDVTPDNIYITNSGEIKLLDFGAARYSLGDKTKSLDVILKKGFAPIEQYSRHGKQGPFTDVYSLGATFYYALCGHKPPDSIDRIEKDTLVSLSSRGIVLPKEEELAIYKALSVRPEDRFQTMKEFGAPFLNGMKKPLAQNAYPAMQYPAGNQMPNEPLINRNSARKAVDNQTSSKKSWVVPVIIIGAIVLVVAICLLIYFL